jgi:hypothetical protein
LLAEKLGAGETEAIGLALELGNARVILDDHAARICARANGVAIIGVVGVILRAKADGCLAAVKPTLDALRQTGFYIGPSLYAHAVRQAGETP